MRCLIAFDSKGFPLQKCIEKLGHLRCKLGAENGESKKAGCGKTAPKFSQEDDRYCQILWKHSKEATKTVLFFFKTSGGRFYLASTHAWFAWDQSWFFPSFVRYCNLRMPTCINNAPWQRFALCVATGCFGLSLGRVRGGSPSDPEKQGRSATFSAAIKMVCQQNWKNNLTIFSDSKDGFKVQTHECLVHPLP